MPGRRKKTQMGGSTLGKIGNVLKQANKIARKTKIISTGLSLIPNPTAQVIGNVARSVGYGRRKRKCNMQGRGNRIENGVLGIGYQISRPIF